MRVDGSLTPPSPVKTGPNTRHHLLLVADQGRQGQVRVLFVDKNKIFTFLWFL